MVQLPFRRDHTTLFPTVSSDGIASFCRGEVQQSERHSKKSTWKIPFLRRNRQLLLLDLGITLAWSLSYAFHTTSEELLWNGMRALGRHAAKTC